MRTAIAGIACIAALAACGASPSASDSGADDDVASLGTVGETDGSTDDSTQDSTTADSVDPQEAFVEYTECMRDEGIDMPDPQFTTAEPGRSGQVITVNSSASVGDDTGPLIDFDSDEYAAANEACGSLLDDAFGDIEIDPELEAEQREQMLAFAECMRDQGLDFPDPVFSDNGGATQTFGGDQGDGPSEDGPGGEKWEAAFEVCGDDMPPMIAGGRVDQADG